MATHAMWEAASLVYGFGQYSQYDLAIIGGGINGCGIARDAAGRGLGAHLSERADLASGTSSALTKLIHGGLRYLEHCEFGLVREAQMERKVLWGIARHIVWPLRFVLPHHDKLRPAWLLRLGLFFYDNLGGRKRLPATRTLRLRSDPAGAVLKPEFSLGFAYSDCWVDDARLVVLNAADAARCGATIATRATRVSATRNGSRWLIVLRDEASGEQPTIAARTLVNAAGPWVADVAGLVIRANTQAKVRLVRGSHIVVPRLYEHEGRYIFQNEDNRIFFVIPYEQDFTLIGTTDQDFKGDPTGILASDAESTYLCRSASVYLRTPVTPEMVVWTHSGVCPLYDDGATAALEATRAYVCKLEAPVGSAPLLSVFGGKLTTYRRHAESALAKLLPHLPMAHGGMAAGWTGRERLLGGDFARDGFEAQVQAATARYPFVPAETLRRLVRAYGTNVNAALGEATTAEARGREFGAGLFEAQLRYLARADRARAGEDVVWRRSKLGLRLTPPQIDAADVAMRRIALDLEPAVPGTDSIDGMGTRA